MTTRRRKISAAAALTVAIAATAAAGAAYGPAGATDIEVGINLDLGCLLGGCRTLAVSPVGEIALPGAEIAAYDALHKRVWVTDAVGNQLTLVDLRRPSAPAVLRTISLAAYGATVTSVSISGRHVAAGTRPDATAGSGARGTIVLLNLDGDVTDTETAGFGPDSVTFSPDGNRVLVANEGEPNSYGQPGSVDPAGSVTVLDVAHGRFVRNREVTFTSLTTANLPAGVRYSSPAATVAQDIEPEYIAFSKDSRKAFVTLQENNAVAEIDVDRAKLGPIRPAGYVDHSLDAFGIDASDQDLPVPNILPRKGVLGMRMPDAIASFTQGGRTYYVTANEGDSREYTGFRDDRRVSAVPSGAQPSTWTAAENTAFRLPSALGRLTVTKEAPWTAGSPLYVFGSRSFSIFDDHGTLVHDSGSEFERVTASAVPLLFNSDGVPGGFDTRSDNKGPEPEGLAVGEVYGKQIAVVGLERTGGLMVYDISRPSAPKLLTYLPGSATSAGPEGIQIIPALASPTLRPLIITANEVGNSLSVYEIQPN